MQGTIGRIEVAPAFGQRDPDVRGYYGAYGGRFVPETLVEPVAAVERAYLALRRDPAFAAEFESLLRRYVGRPTPLYEAARLSEAVGCRVFLKRGYARRDMAEYRGRVPGCTAHIEHLRFRRKRQRLQKPREHHRLHEIPRRLTARRVLHAEIFVDIGKARARFRDEFLARHFQHGRDQGGVGDIVHADLTVHHGPPRLRKVDHRKCFSEPAFGQDWAKVPQKARWRRAARVLLLA